MSFEWLGCSKSKWFLAIVIIGCCFSVTAEAAGNLNISASAAIVMDQQTGQVLWAKNPDWQRPIASLTKIMTAILVLELNDLDESVAISREAARTPGSSMYLRMGVDYRVRDLLHGLMLLSGNDAAVALAEHSCGSVDQFVAFMNKKAVLLGASLTSFTNPHGLPDTEHYSTAYDMAVLTRHALDISEFASLVASNKAVIPDPLEAAHRPIYNKNRLLWEFEGADGVKTGYTLAAGRCLAASATRHGRQVIVIVLDAPRLWEDAAALLTYGLEEFENMMLAKKGQILGSVHIEGGLSDTVTVVGARDVWLTVPKQQRDAIQVDYAVPTIIGAPVMQWSPLGNLRVQFDHQVVAETPLLAGESIAVRSWMGRLQYLVRRLQNLLANH
ncbi:MAG: D-alanyl-D-alanine carboxypeptidase [Firmicutes bacterium]|nr:D-alanyl-D-alanine carboxypeptidase [Bacillota bacterium]